MRRNLSYIIKLEKISRKAISIDKLYDFSLTIFLCFSAFQFAVSYFLSPLGLGNVSRIVTIMVIYVPILFTTLQKKRITNDFWLIWIFVVLFFMVTYLIHPEYEPWYTRAEYGVFDYVLSPENGLYLYLLIRLVNDPERILRCIRLSSWPMYFYYAIHVQRALARGYWIDTSNRGYEIHISYNLSLGYNLLLFTLAFLYCALEKKKLYDWIGTAIGMGLILLAGSRGPILDILIFLVIYIIIKIGKSKKGIITVVGVIAVGLSLYFAYPYLLMGLTFILRRFNLSSRFLNKLTSGTIFDDAGRIAIWRASLDMIKKKPLGYGAMGSRHVISQYIYVAHPHNFILEVLIDFGVIIGPLIILWLLYWTIKLFSIKDNAWRGVFLVFFSRACQLILSLTFWHSIGFWGTLAVGVCMWRTCERNRRIIDGR